MRERVRCSSLFDWPVYPRFIRDYVGGLAVAQLSALGAGCWLALPSDWALPDTRYGLRLRLLPARGNRALAVSQHAGEHDLADAAVAIALVGAVANLVEHRPPAFAAEAGAQPHRHRVRLRQGAWLALGGQPGGLGGLQAHRAGPAQDREPSSLGRLALGPGRQGSTRRFQFDRQRGEARIFSGRVQFAQQRQGQSGWRSHRETFGSRWVWPSLTAPRHQQPRRWWLSRPDRPSRSDAAEERQPSPLRPHGRARQPSAHAACRGQPPSAHQRASDASGSEPPAPMVCRDRRQASDLLIGARWVWPRWGQNQGAQMSENIRREIILVPVPVAGSPEPFRKTRPAPYPQQQRQHWRPANRPPSKAHASASLLRRIVENEAAVRRMLHPRPQP
jgi:hypothetical protein